MAKQSIAIWYPGGGFVWLKPDRLPPVTASAPTWDKAVRWARKQSASRIEDRMGRWRVDFKHHQE